MHIDNSPRASSSGDGRSTPSDGKMMASPVQGTVWQRRSTEEEVRSLENYCQSFQTCDDAPPQWRVLFENCECQALVEVELLAVPHKFCGPFCSTEEEARAQTAKRALWYLKCPGYEMIFEPDLTADNMAKCKPPVNWASDASEEAALHVAERKTAVMRIQNRLQHALSQKLKPGESVWEWSYEPDNTDGSWPPLCRASVQVAALGIEFAGDWVRGHRGAQLDTCVHVTQFLDRLDAEAGGTLRVGASTPACGSVTLHRRTI